jgi:hypothetical protein
LKLVKRLLLTLPFVLVTLVYNYFNDPDDMCQGLADMVRNVLLYTFLLLTLTLAVFAISEKQQFANLKFEPFSMTVTILTLIFLLFSFFYRGHTNGEIYLTAENKTARPINEKQVLTLRKNGNFTITFSETDFSCSVSSIYKQVGDTIIFDNSIIDKTASKMTTKYLIKEKQIIPISDTTDKIFFNVLETK